MKKALIIIIGLCAVGVLCLVGVALFANAEPPTPLAPPIPSASPASPGKVLGSATAGAVKKTFTIDGNDLVHVGSDVPAGTYRADEKVDGSCYWKKTVDPEGSNIIDNDIPAGGRPQVTLKKGQWFASSRCPTWVKQ
jgi:hypothetical protein